MKRVIVTAGVGIMVICVAFAAAADPHDFVERGQRLKTDAIRDNLHIDRLQIPAHPLEAQQLPQHLAAADDGSARSASPERSHRVRSRRRPHTHAMPRGKSERNIQLREQQQK